MGLIKHVGSRESCAEYIKTPVTEDSMDDQPQDFLHSANYRKRVPRESEKLHVLNRQPILFY